jgi:hypothetical protein
MGSLTVHVLDGKQKPLQGKKVFCNYPGILPMHSERYTGEGGVAQFDDVPVCTVEVFLGGKLRLRVGVGSSDHKDVTVTV